jgi:hypothetical protein
MSLHPSQASKQRAFNSNNNNVSNQFSTHLLHPTPLPSLLISVWKFEKLQIITVDLNSLLGGMGMSVSRHDCGEGKKYHFHFSHWFDNIFICVYDTTTLWTEIIVVRNEGKMCWIKSIFRGEKICRKIVASPPLASDIQASKWSAIWTFLWRNIKILFTPHKNNNRTRIFFSFNSKSLKNDEMRTKNWAWYKKYFSFSFSLSLCSMNRQESCGNVKKNS